MTTLIFQCCENSRTVRHLFHFYVEIKTWTKTCCELFSAWYSLLTRNFTFKARSTCKKFHLETFIRWQFPFFEWQHGTCPQLLIHSYANLFWSRYRAKGDFHTDVRYRAKCTAANVHALYQYSYSIIVGSIHDKLPT